jgi:hypothetical protein
MDTSITRLDRIRAEARQAAAKYSDINAACPYPFLSGAAIEFTREFEAERSRLNDLPDDANDDSEAPWCDCGNTPGFEELDWNKCDSCGKPITP